VYIYIYLYFGIGIVMTNHVIWEDIRSFTKNYQLIKLVKKILIMFSNFKSIMFQFC